MCFFYVVFAQQDTCTIELAKKGNLTYGDCVKLANKNNLVYLGPSLYALKDKCENQSVFNDKEYYNVVMLLCNYVMNYGDISTLHKTIDDAILTYGRRSAESNNEYVRWLWRSKGQIEENLNNCELAICYLKVAQSLYEEAYDFSDNYVATLIDLAKLYKEEGNVMLAKMYIDEAIEQFETTYGNIYNITNESHFSVLYTYGNICNLVGHVNEAVKCFKYIIDHCQKTPIAYNTYYLTCNNLGTIYWRRGDLESAKKMFEKIHIEYEQPNDIYTQNLSLCYLYSHNYKEAVSLLSEYNKILADTIVKVFSQTIGNESDKYWNKKSSSVVTLNNLIAFQTNNPEAISQSFNNTIFCKNFLLHRKKVFDDLITQTDNNQLKESYQKYKRLRSVYAYKTTNTAEIESLKWELYSLEKLIAKSLTGFEQIIQENTKKWTDVQNMIDENDVAIEFCYLPVIKDTMHYGNFDNHYGAFIVKKGYPIPKLVLLANVDSVNNLFISNTNDEVLLYELYKPEKSRHIYEMIWKSLTQYIDDGANVYYSTFGQLSNVNFDIIEDENGIMLNEKYNLFRVSSTAIIDDIKKMYHSTYKDATLYGNIKYDEPIEEMATESSKYISYTGTSINDELSLRSENERGKWGTLPFTKVEIDNIKDILTSAGVEAKIIESISASEESFKAMDGKSPDILHFATHGFVFDKWEKTEGNKFVEQTNLYSQKESYLMWSGLLMAGANNIWQGKFDMHNIEDGVLTADEISRMDLKQTKMVVLSACETAKGKIDYIDGVFGLQRGFKKAGAGTIVMSLWKVQDDATSMLMTTFYRNLLNGEERHKALWNAMMEVRKVYDDPYYWGGFIMLD